MDVGVSRFWKSLPRRAGQVDISSPRKGGEGEACRWWWVKGVANTLLLGVGAPLIIPPTSNFIGGPESEEKNWGSKVNWACRIQLKKNGDMY